MDLDAGELCAFVTVAEELHFGRAALRLNISQPQVSRRVRMLEERLGVELFVRTARRTTLTDAGEMLLLDAREALAGLDRLQARARVIRSGAGGRVSVGFLWSTLSAFLPQLVAAAADRHRDIELSVSQLVFLEMLPALRRGDVDLIIGRSPREDTEIVEETLRREPSVLAIPEGHPFARQDTVRLSELDREPMIAFNRALVPRAYDASIAAARERGVEIRIVQHARSASEALALVSAGLGVYRLPASAVAPYPGVTYRELEDAPARVVLLRRPSPPPPAVAAIAVLAHDLFGDASDASNDAALGLEGALVRT
ncbi:MAG TPA: LysR family transcriptional regulator [Solirubrobacteraceae bacterium]|nr:LysR family transcriptional regulator [Solirubrobacteraceae bacterium]